MRGAHFLAVLFAFALAAAFVSAADSDMCATADVTSVSPASVEANEDFIVGIEIGNCGTADVIPDNITFQITRFSEDVYIKEPLATYVGKLAFANSKRFITYHMRTSPNPAPGDHYFEANLTYGSGAFYKTQTYTFSVNVRSDSPSITVSGIKASPEKVVQGEDIILTVKVQNDGKGDAKSVRVRLEGLDFEGTRDAYLGEVKAGEELPARFVLRAGNSGQYDYNIKIFYDFAGSNEMAQFPSSIHVFYKFNIWYVVIPAIVLAIVLVFFYIRKIEASKEDED